MDNRQWKNMFEIAKQYYDEKGNLLVFGKYVTTENIKLGSWIGRQRKDYKENKLSKEKIVLLEQIGMVWSVYDTNWHENYALAKNYFENKGNLLIPGLYTTNNGINLGAWIKTQRKQYKEDKLSKDKIKLLEKIGMVWSIFDIQWNEYYELASEYYKENNNLLVPLRYKTTDNKKLGYWISDQRICYKSGKLSNDKIEMLEKIGMAWDATSAIWNFMYKKAKQYYEENHNLSISSTTFTYQNASLGSWIVTQRKNYSEGKLSDTQILMLNKIGMEWVYSNNPDYVWEKNYNTVLEFYSRYKHLYIPIGFVTEDGIRLGVWLHDRKYEYEHNELSEDRRKKLDELDKTWRESINTKSSFPEQAVLYYIKMGYPSATKYSSKELSEIDIFIPELKVGIEYDGSSHADKTKRDIEKCEKCKKEGIDLIRIRDSVLPDINDESYKIILRDNSFESLNDGIIELLKHLNISNNISVDVKKDYIEIADNYIKTIDLDWYLMYERLKEYKNKYGNINVPIYYKTSDGILLGHWLSNIRSSYKNPTLGNIRLNSNKIKLLEKLGIDWAPIDTQWQNIYLLAKQYYEENGDLLIPDKYVTSGSIKLGRWIATQRHNYKEGIISEEKIKLLDQIGMIWSIHDYEWMNKYSLAVTYFKEKGNLVIANSYKTQDGVSLGWWIMHQRKRYKENKISERELALLNQIGMVWNV